MANLSIHWMGFDRGMSCSRCPYTDRRHVTHTAPLFGVAVALDSRLETVGEPSGSEPQRGLTGILAYEGLAMLTGGQIEGISREGAFAPARLAILAASLPALLLGGLLLSCP